MDEDSLGIAFRLLLTAALVAANGFFVAAEFAIVAARGTRVEQRAEAGSKPARLLRRAMGDNERYIATAQLGITMASLALGWVGEPAVEALIEPIFGLLAVPWQKAVSHVLAVAIAFALITSVHIVLGEQAPKVLALRHPEATGYLVIGPTEWFLRVFRPFIRLLSIATSLVLRPFGLDKLDEHHRVHSPDEILMLVEASERAGQIAVEEREMIDRVFAFGDLRVHQVMVPRTEVAGLPLAATLEEARSLAAETGHSRFPVFDGSLDNVVGVITATELLRPDEPGTFRLADRMRTPLIVPDTIEVNQLLAEMRRSRSHFAVAIDEFGGTAGIVTLGDLLERVFGDVLDENQGRLPEAEELDDGSWLVDGLTLIGDFNDRFGRQLDATDFDTVGGYVFGRLGRKPEVGDRVAIDGLDLKVAALDGLRVASIRVVPEKIDDPAEK